MITSFQLNFGKAPDVPSEEIPVTPVTVFVGPNNSGKSRILREMEYYCRNGQKETNSLLLSDIEFRSLSLDEGRQFIERLQQVPLQDEFVAANHIILASRYGRIQVFPERFYEAIQSPQAHIKLFCQWFLNHCTLMLNGENRINLINMQNAGDLQQAPQNSFQTLLRNDAKRHEIRRILFDAFERYFVLDPTNLGQLRIRFSDRAPSNDIEERGIHDEAVRFHTAAQSIDTMSDGVKAFTGIITELIAGDPSIILIDEPEAFLHPPLAYKLGQEVARSARSADKRVFASTHSSQFVMGCVQSGAPVTIVRLTYRGGTATARVLPSDELLELMRHPLLRSTGVLNGLFYESVIVTESDADRAFYQEINERLLQFKPEWGIPNCLFINAQNKQTVQTLVRPLRKLGIPTVGIVDIDVLKDGGKSWSDLITSIEVPELSKGGLANTRSAIKQAIDATGKDIKRDGGLQILPPNERQAAEDLLDQLRQYGLFVVPGGELESWMTSLEATGHGPSWLIQVFEHMGEDPNDPDYVQPGSDDVWAFLYAIRQWLLNPNRKGIPA
jgi:ABC-type cobalamin/Fe3+-siderophores transport system ATPase subunit